jgi:hypothetical protein
MQKQGFFTVGNREGDPVSGLCVEPKGTWIVAKIFRILAPFRRFL